MPSGSDQIVNITSTDLTAGINYDLAKPYNFQKLAVGSTVFSAYGTMLPLSATPNATSGTIGFSSYSDTIGGNAPADAYFAYFTTLGPGVRPPFSTTREMAVTQPTRLSMAKSPITATWWYQPEPSRTGQIASP